ncbi:glycosyl hydrolase family 28-related protein [Aliikangiella coralliicola]|uniref:glycosyl hydrolase family 28-related protein n=1 Tax=Aliikangiella coralliicola TaxID=2592383 RepID=UPI00143DB145|nr:glycosyl hydrolase family 28-related protein [Aliikangiella coralliicola]
MNITYAKTFNVEDGCEFNGSTISAVGDGQTDDSAAIQHCLLAAGEWWRTQVWEANNASTEQVEVLIPAGKYFVQGQFLTTFPLRGAYDPYLPQYGVFVLPPGVKIRGEGLDQSIISLTPTFENRTSGEGKRIGTHVFMGGFEKQTIPTDPNFTNGYNNYCNDVLAEEQKDLLCEISDDGRSESVYKLRSFCGQLESQNHIALNLVCGKPETQEDPLTPEEKEAQEKYISATGSFNTLANLQIRGDREGMLAYQSSENNITRIRSVSSAIALLEGHELLVEYTRLANFYRTIFAIHANDVTIRNNHFHNGWKAHIAILQPVSHRPLKKPWNDTVVTKKGKLFIGTNSLTNDVFFLRDLEVLEKQGVNISYAVLMGMFISGNISSACQEATVVNNTLTSARIEFHIPCQSVEIMRNTVLFNALPIRLGSHFVNSRFGMGIRRVLSGEYQVKIYDNDLRENLSGIHVLGCNDRKVDDTRCNNILDDQVLISGNRLTQFLSFDKKESYSKNDPRYWAYKMQSFSPYDRRPSGISVLDINGVDIKNNVVTGLEPGSQMYGIGIANSFYNIRAGDHPQVHPYGGVFYNKNISLTGNEVSFRAGGASQNVGVYVENTLQLEMAENNISSNLSNRLINASVAAGDDTSDFCSRTLFDITKAECKRLIFANGHIMDNPYRNCFISHDGPVSGVCGFSQALYDKYDYSAGYVKHDDEIFDPDD